MNYQRLSKNALGCMYLSAVVGMLVKMVILSAVYLLFFQDNKIALIIYGALMGISLLSCVFKPYFNYHFYKYNFVAPHLYMIFYYYLNFCIFCFY